MNRNLNPDKNWRAPKKTAAEPVDVTGSLFPKFLKKNFAILCASLLVGMLLYFILITSPKVPFHAFYVSEYEAPLPPSPLLSEDIGFATESFKARNLEFFSDDIKPYTNDNFIAKLGDQLKRASPGGPDGNVVFVYISAHGAVNRSNEPCLLLSGALPYDCSTWLPVERVLDGIVEANKQRGKKKTKTIIVLDSTRIRDEWGFGIIHNPFARELDNLITKEQFRNENLFILCSANDGQTSHVAPELQGTVFSHFLTRGLYGEADGFDGYRRNSKVSILELEAYLKKNVNSWVAKYRNSVQIPRFAGSLTEDDDFNVAKVTERKFDLSAEPDRQYLDEAKDRQRQLVGLWKDFAELESDRAFRFAPALWAKLQREVRRANQLIFAGKSYSDQFELARATATTTVKRIREANKWQDLPRSASLSLQTQSEGMLSFTSDKYQDLEAAWDKYLAAPEESSVNERLDEVFDDQALPMVAWRALVGASGASNVSIKELKTQLSLTYKAWEKSSKNLQHKAQSTPPPELHLVRMVGELLDWESASPQLGPQTKRILNQYDQLASLSSNPDPRVQFWTNADLAKAIAKWREANDHLFVGSSKALQTSNARLNACADLLKPIRNKTKTVEEAYAQRDQAWAKLPYLWEWALGQSDFKKALAVDLVSLTETTHELGDALIHPDEASVGKLKRLTDVHKSLLEDVEREFADWAERLTNPEESIGPIQHRLSIPLSVNDATDNFKLLSDRLLGDVGEGNGRTYVYSESENALATPAEPSDRLDWFERQTRHPALMLVDGQERAKPDGDDESPIKRSKWSEIGGQIRDRLFFPAPSAPKKRCLTTEFREEALKAYAALPSSRWESGRNELADADNDMRAAVGLVRGNHQWIVATELRELDRSSQLLWQARQRLLNGWGWHADKRVDYYFSRASQALIDNSDGLIRQGISRHAKQEFQPPFEASALRAAQSDLVKAFDEWNPVELESITSEVGQQTAEPDLEVMAQDSIPAGSQAIYFVRSKSLFDVRDLKRNMVVRRREAETRRRSTLKQRLDGVSTELRETHVVALYRGHRYEKALAVTGGVFKEFVRPIPPTVTVKRGENTSRYRLMFVLDCSASMRVNDSHDRLEEAIEILTNLLPSLDSEYIEVGLIAFGHRFNCDQQELLRSALAPAIVQPIHPLEDAEVVVAPAPFSKNRNQWVDFFGQVKAHGVTPLYYAIVNKALPSFKNGNIVGQIVVLTDGNQTDLSGMADSVPVFLRSRISTQATKLADKDKGKKDVIREIKKHSKLAVTEIDIVDLARVAQPGALEDIASSSKGQFEVVSAKNDLAHILQKLLGVPDFYIRKAAAEEVTLKLEKTVVLEDNLMQGPIGPFEIGPLLKGGSNSSSTLRPLTGIYFEGGEDIFVDAIKEQPQELPTQLKYQDFQTTVEGLNRSEVREDLLKEAELQNEKYHLFPLTVIGDKVNRVFRLAIQLKDRTKFTKKPPTVWAEIQPLNKDGEPVERLRYAYLRDFENGASVPVMRFVVSDWPAEASQASFTVWFELPSNQRDVLPTMTELDGAKSISVVEPQQPYKGVRFESEVEGRHLKLFEIHSSTSEEYPLHVQLEPKSLVHTRVESYFQGVARSSNGKTVTHDFGFPNGTDMPTLRKQIKFQILSSDAIKNSKAKETVKVGPIRLNLN